jgi:hypothetical protein
MGNFYTNITLRGPSQDDVFSALEDRSYRAFVVPTRNGLTVIYEKDCEDQDTNDLTHLGEYLTGRLDCVGLAVLNHDDDVLWLRLFDSGKSVVEYVSRRGSGSGAWALCRAFGRWFAWPLLWPLMRIPYFLFEVYRHLTICALLGIPRWSVGLGYRYIEEGDEPIGLAPDQLRGTK